LHFPYQVFAIAISPRTYVVCFKLDNFVQPKEWKDFTQKSRNTSVLITNEVINPMLDLSPFASRRVVDCAKGGIFASESWSYDGLPAGVVSSGLLTSHTINRRATDNGASLGSVRMFDATYDVAGNLAAVRMQRDGDERTVTFAYDPFGNCGDILRLQGRSCRNCFAPVNYQNST